MKIGKLILPIVVSIFLLTLAGCGSEGDTNGNLTLSLVATDTLAGQYKVDATATYSKAYPNVPIIFYWRKLTPSDPTGSQSGNSGSTGNVPTDNLGVAKQTFYVGQTAENIFFQVEAKTGNVSSGNYGVSIPAL